MTGQILGREAELAELLDRLRHRRLVTLVGPGGIGKTALAEVAAAAVGPEFAYGAVTVDLTRIDRAEGVQEAMASQLGFADFQSLVDSPGDQPALMLVDNCEHVLDAAASTIEWILNACDMPTVLATSRAPLDLPDETIVTVGPLDTPDEESVELDTPAMRLLAERVRDQGVAPEELDPTLLAEICRRLDGVPLALELAAARLRSVSPRELLTELDERPHALARRRFRGQESHRSVAEVVGWSTDLLDPEPKATFSRLGVFAGPFTAAMAEPVVASPADGQADGDGQATSGMRFADVLIELVDASLVVADATGDTTWYRLLHPVRAVALEQLRESGELHRTTDRFIDQVVASAINVIALASERWQSDALPELLALYDNMAASIRWLLEHDEKPDRTLTLVAVLWGLIHQAHTADIGALGEAALTRWENGEDSALWPDAVATVCTCRSLTGKHQASIELAERTLPAADRSPFAPCTLRRVLGQTYRMIGQTERSLEIYDEAVELAAERGAHGFALELLVTAGMTQAELGEVEAGLERIEQALAEAVDRGATVNEAWAMTARAYVLLAVDPTEAELAAGKARARSEEIGYPIGNSGSRRVLAKARMAQGDLAGAAAHAVELLDELLARGGLNDLRLMLDVAAEIAKLADAPRWSDLAATAQQLPVTSLMVPLKLGFAVDDGQVLSTRDAYVLARDTMRSIAEGSEAAAETQPDAADGGEGANDRRRASMVSEGEIIRVDYAGSTIRLKRSKGLLDLASLLGSPGREISCLDLMGAGLVATSAESELIDSTARRNYEDRVRELQADIELAEANNDTGTAERLRMEMDALVDELTASLGLGGRSRTTTNPAERARSAVTQRLRSTVKRVADNHPVLGEHLKRSITTGLFCSYSPADSVEWEVAVEPG